MQLIVLSPPCWKNLHWEIETATAMFENGLEVFHVYKPDFSEEKVQNYMQTFPEKYRGRIFRHSEFLKLHALRPLPFMPVRQGTLIFLSPVFDSISKAGYQSPFDLRSIKAFLRKQKRIAAKEGKHAEWVALGGIDEDKIGTVRHLGFDGIAVLGAVWQSENPLEKFRRIKSLIVNG